MNRGIEITNIWIDEAAPIPTIEHPPEKIAKAEEYLRDCAKPILNTVETLQLLELHGFHEIDVEKLREEIAELGDFPKYQFRLKRINLVNHNSFEYMSESDQFIEEIASAPPKVKKQFDDAQRLGVFTEYEILKVEKVPDPILVGRYKSMWFEISRWT
jgi:hypothetical protein